MQDVIGSKKLTKNSSELPLVGFLDFMLCNSIFVCVFLCFLVCGEILVLGGEKGTLTISYALQAVKGLPLLFIDVSHLKPSPLMYGL